MERLGARSWISVVASKVVVLNHSGRWPRRCDRSSRKPWLGWGYVTTCVYLCRVFGLQGLHDPSHTVAKLDYSHGLRWVVSSLD